MDMVRFTLWHCWPVRLTGTENRHNGLGCRVGGDGQSLCGITEGPSARKRTLRIWHRTLNCPSQTHQTAPRYA
jgi:hypothetical protein